MKNSGIPWIGDIPYEWKVARLKNIKANVPYSIVDGPFGSAISTNDYQDSGVPLVRIVNLSGKFVDSSSTVFISENLANEVKRSSFGLGDIIVAKTGATVGKCSINNSIEFGILSSSCVRVKVSPKFDNRYFYFLFQTNEFNNALRDASGGSTRDTINLTPFNNLNCVIPSYAEQKAIADFLDVKCAEIDEMISLQEKIIEELKAYKQSVITEAVTKGLNPDVPMKDSGIEWIGEIPEHWSIDKIIRSFGLIGSGTTPKSTDEDNFIGNIRWIQSGDINGGVMTECKNRISEKTLHTTSALKIYNPPFIIIAMYGASVGNTSISMIDGCVNQACCVLSESYLNLEYSFNVIKSCKDFWIRKAVGGGQPNISQDTIKSTWIPIPPKEEQKQIASYLNTKCTEIDNLISIKLSKIDSLNEYKKSIIYEYVTGQKEVTE